jgi:hypothetical protein
VITDADFPGPAFDAPGLKPTAEPTAQACATACLASVNCEAAVFVDHGTAVQAGQLTCYLKAGIVLEASAGGSGGTMLPQPTSTIQNKELFLMIMQPCASIDWAGTDAGESYAELCSGTCESLDGPIYTPYMFAILKSKMTS